MITATNPGQFDYQHYLHNQGISSQFLINDSTASNCSGSSFYQMLYNARNQLLEHLGGVTSILSLFLGSMHFYLATKICYQMKRLRCFKIGIFLTY
ncbi:hypothetical protein [Gracilibacillus sp. JCM 18860]|uniref:hypothetical protein n=1 Tax=Gracilibacillus sp. JCM 18860 TaxID=1306159 RepID=UPI000A7B23B3